MTPATAMGEHPQLSRLEKVTTGWLAQSLPFATQDSTTNVPCICDITSIVSLPALTGRRSAASQQSCLPRPPCSLQ